MKSYIYEFGIIKRFVTLLCSLLLAALAACGGGGGSAPGSTGTSATNAPTSALLSGVAAVGAPIANATIYISCASGNPVPSTSTNSNGS